MATCKPGDILYASFPFSDLNTERRRPVLVLSAQKFNQQSGHVVCAMITQARSSKWPQDYPLRHPEAAGLHVPCVVRFKIFTLSQDKILKKLGALHREDWRKARQRLENNILF